MRKSIKLNKMGAFMVIAVALNLSVGICKASSDSIVLKNKKSYTGMFTGFKNKRIYFTPTEGKDLNLMNRAVTSVTLSPVAKVYVKIQGKSKRGDLKLKSFDKGKFTFLDSEGKDVQLARITIIEMQLDFSRTMVPTIKTVDGDQKDVDISTILSKTMLTIVHFHKQSKKPSSHLRMENYIDGLDGKKKGKSKLSKPYIKVVRINFSDWDSAAAVKYEIKSTPQFWFYNKRGKLVKKLIDRFTDADIDAALKEAQR